MQKLAKEKMKYQPYLVLPIIAVCVVALVGAYITIIGAVVNVLG